MKRIFFYLIILPFLLMSAKPLIYHASEMISPRSLTKDEQLVKALVNLQKGTLTAADSVLLRAKFPPDSPSNKKITRQLIASGMVLNMADRKLRNLFHRAQSGDIDQINMSVLELERTGLIEEMTTDISSYLAYYSLVRSSSSPFNLQRLSDSISPEDIRKVIEKIVRNEITKNDYFQLEFLFGEMIRKLKDQVPQWPGEGNFEGGSEYLAKGRIYQYIFSDLLGDWKNISALGLSEMRQSRTQRLSTVILLHMNYAFGIQDFRFRIRHGENYQGAGLQRDFKRSSQNNPYTYGLPPEIAVWARGANLQNAYLRGVNLGFQNARYINLENADLEEAVFRYQNRSLILNGINLRATNLRKTQWCKDIQLNEANLEEALLGNLDFSGATLENANLRRANLEGIKLNNANLEGANLEGANLQEADIRKSRLKKTNFFKTNLVEVDARKAFFSEARLEKADLTDALLEEADFENTTFYEANLTGASFFDAQLNKADLRRAHLKGAVFDSTLFIKVRIYNSQLDFLPKEILERVEKINNGSILIIEDDPTYRNEIEDFEHAV